MRSDVECALPGARMRRVREYLHAHFDEVVTVQDLARVADLSRVHVTRAFARTYGVPPHQYLSTLRLRHARTAMLQGNPLSTVRLRRPEPLQPTLQGSDGYLACFVVAPGAHCEASMILRRSPTISTCVMPAAPNDGAGNGRATARSRTIRWNDRLSLKR